MGVRVEFGKGEETRERQTQAADRAPTAQAGPGKTHRHPFQPQALRSNNSAFMDKAKGEQLLGHFFQKHPAKSQLLL